MRNELWEVIGKKDLQEIDDLEFRAATSGSPYQEVVKMDGQQVTVNPYLKDGELLADLLVHNDFMESEEGKLLFHQAIHILLQIERYKGCDKNFFLKKIIEREILEKRFGEEINQFYHKLTREEQTRTLENILFFYQHRQHIDVFVREVVAIYPHCMLFQKKKEQKHIYIYMGIPKDRQAKWMIERCGDLFLPMDTQIHIAWEEAFLLTDMHRLEAEGKCIV